MGDQKNIKVVWLCHFANQQMKDYFKTPNLNEFAPWISLSIELFKQEPQIELHIVSPNIFNNKEVGFKKDTIYYHFFKYLPVPVYNKYSRKLHSISRFDTLTDFYWIKNKVKKIVNRINPDIIHLHGAENAFFYSSGIIPLIGKYPIITTIQGFVRKSTLNDYQTRIRIKIEEHIIKRTKYFGIRETKEMVTVVTDLNPNAKFFYHNYPISIPHVVKDNIGKEEPIDCIFFARVCKDKGIEDLLQAISHVKKKIPQINLSVVGGVDSEYKNILGGIVKQLDIEENVKFHGYLQTQQDIHQLAYNAKVCVLPTYHDILPGTVLESMFIKLPVIAYAVGGLPELNKTSENIILVKKLNINELSGAIISILSSDIYRRKLTENAHSFVQKQFDNTYVSAALLHAYHEILGLQ